MDIATLPWSEDGYRYFLLVVDLFAKYVELMAMKDQTATTVASAFRDGWVYKHGVPRVLVTDQAHNVDGEVMNELCRGLNIEKRRTSPYHPEGDGSAERAIQSVKQIMRCLLAERQLSTTDWPHVLTEVSFVMNAMHNASTKVSPHQLYHGTDLQSFANSTLDRLELSHDTSDLSTHSDHLKFVRDEVNALSRIAADNLQHTREKVKEAYDKGKACSQLQKGDWVLLDDRRRGSALDPLYRGPYQIIHRRGVNVKLRDLASSKEKVVHLNRCRPYRSAGGVPLMVMASGVDETDCPDDSSDEDVDMEVPSETDGDERPATALPPPRRSQRQPAPRNFGPDIVTYDPDEPFLDERD